MANNITKRLATDPKFGVAVLTTQTGATELGTSLPSNGAAVVSAPQYGCVVKRVKIKGRDGALVAGHVRLFIVISSSYNIFLEIDVPTTSAPSHTVKSYDSDWIDVNIDLPDGATLYATTTQTHKLNVIAQYHEFLSDAA